MDETVGSLAYRFAAMTGITLAVTCLGGLFDVWRSKERLTWRGVKKALLIGFGLPLALLGFGLASAGIAAAYNGVLRTEDILAKATSIPFLVILVLPILAIAIFGAVKRTVRRS